MNKRRDEDQWAAISELVGMIPGVQAVAGGVARTTVERLLGFWMLYHMYGGVPAGVKAGVMSESSAYRKKGEFVEVFGMDVEDFAPEVAEFMAKVRRGEA